MLQHHFIAVARQTPKKLAFIDKATNREISYRQALTASFILARRLRRFEKGSIGIMLPTSAGAALATLGALIAGLTPVMINYSTGAEKNCLFAQSKCDFRTIITTAPLLEKCNCPLLPEMVLLEEMLGQLSIYEKVIATLKIQLPLWLLRRCSGKQNPESNAVILFTSGSEKEPKVVPLTHRNILSNIEGFSDALAFEGMDRLLAILPFFHVFGFTTNLWMPIYHGMTSITYPNPLDYKIIARLIKEQQIKVLVGTPVFLEGYLKQSKPGDFVSIELAVCGADKCPEALRKAYLEKHNIEILEGYGTTETSPVLSVNTKEANKPGSIGRPITGVRVKIQDYDSGDLCATGKMGKILVKGDSIMKGYLNDLEETSLRIKSGWYDTGDLGYLDEDGFLWHCGRLKRFLKIGGEMVSLVQVEDALSQVLPEGIECCAVELPDAKRGAKIVAVVNAEVEKTEIQKKLAELLPNIALPKDYVVISDFPRMGSGKTDFRTLTNMVQFPQEESSLDPPLALIEANDQQR